MTLLDVAFAHLSARAALADRYTSRALRLWGRADVRDLDLWWDILAPDLTRTVQQGQYEAAAQTGRYLDRVTNQAGPAVVPEAFTGVTIEGRELTPALYGTVTTTKRLIGAGRPPADAFQAGAAFLAVVANTAILDMGRQSDLTGAVGRRSTRYIRVIQPGACSRCAILAGKDSARTAFKRHPRCRCEAMPLIENEGVPEGFMSSPEEYFASLTSDEQDRVFTKAGAEAIRQGANPIKVVNARRGAYGIGYSGHYDVPIPVRNRLQPVTIGVRPDGTPLQVYATTEGTTSRGVFGRNEIRLTDQSLRDGRYRRSTTVRLMPEQIAVMAGGDPDRWVELLTRYGYLY